MTRGKAKFVLLAVVGALAALLSWELGGLPALRGAGLGFLVAVVLCVASHAATLRAARANARYLQASVMIGVFTSFVVMGTFVVVVGKSRPDIVVPSALTAFFGYLAYRILEAFEVSRFLALSGSREHADSERPREGRTQG